MYVARTPQGVLDFIANCLACKEVYKNGEVQAAPRPFPQIADSHSTSQLQISKIYVYCPAEYILSNILSCSAIGAELASTHDFPHNIIKLKTATTRPLTIAAQHVLAAPKHVHIYVSNMYPERGTAIFGAVMYDPNGCINAADCTFISECVYNLPSIYAAARHVLGACLTQYSPVYCEVRGWALQIARQTHPTFSTKYRGLAIPQARNKIIAISSQREQETCTSCGGRTVGKLYTVGSKTGNVICAACATSINVFETVYAHQCGTDCSRPAPPEAAAVEAVHVAAATVPPAVLASDEDLLGEDVLPPTKPEPIYLTPAPIFMLPEELLLAPTKKVGEYLVSQVADKTYIGISNLDYYLRFTNYMGLPCENPVLYYVNIV